MLSPDINIRIDLNSDTFTPADRDELAEQLSTETDLRIESDVAAYTGVDNGPLPPDVAIYILHTLVPIADVYANVLASAIWGRIQAALSRRGDYEPGVPTVTVVEVVGEDGRWWERTGACAETLE